MNSPAPEGSHVVVAEGLQKTFQIPEEATHTLKEHAMHPFRRTRHERFEALRDVSFGVRDGEFFGIVGRNGSGKSTLLKCLAGIYRADEGRIWIDGRVSTFIELGVGFNPDLAAFDNVVLNGIMLGLSPKEARARYERVIEFSELEEFQDLKLKNYSSGMHVRLAFSVAIQVDADILLIDEVLAVGDAAFQQKCFDVFNKMRDEGKTIVFVTHDMAAVTRFCHRALLLERGRIVEEGDPEKVASRYLALNFDHVATSEEAPEQPPEDAREGNGKARVLDVWLEDENGQRPASTAQGENIVIRAHVEFEERLDDPEVRLSLENQLQTPVAVLSTARQDERTGVFAAGERAVFAFSMLNVLAPGRYHTTVTLATRGSGLELIDKYEQQFSFIVTGAHPSGGLVDLPFQQSTLRTDSERVSA
ncbi:MAG: ABC transporter ATP-binding protein [Solirubrobacteraceae bacterium]